MSCFSVISGNASEVGDGETGGVELKWGEREDEFGGRTDEALFQDVEWKGRVGGVASRQWVDELS